MMKTRAMRVVVELHIHGGEEVDAIAVRDAVGQSLDDERLQEVCAPFVENGQIAGVSWEIRGWKTVADPKWAGLAVASSGDPEKDAEAIADHIRSSERMEDGVCPNGCAQLVQLDAFSRECPVCKFVGYQNTPLT